MRFLAVILFGISLAACGEEPNLADLQKRMKEIEDAAIAQKCESLKRMPESRQPEYCK